MTDHDPSAWLEPSALRVDRLHRCVVVGRQEVDACEVHLVRQCTTAHHVRTCFCSGQSSRGRSRHHQADRAKVLQLHCSCCHTTCANGHHCAVCIPESNSSKRLEGAALLPHMHAQRSVRTHAPPSFHVLWKRTLCQHDYIRHCSSLIWSPPKGALTGG